MKKHIERDTQIEIVASKLSESESKKRGFLGPIHKLLIRNINAGEGFIKVVDDLVSLMSRPGDVSLVCTISDFGWSEDADCAGHERTKIRGREVTIGSQKESCVSSVLSCWQAEHHVILIGNRGAVESTISAVETASEKRKWFAPVAHEPEFLAAGGENVLFLFFSSSHMSIEFFGGKRMITDWENEINRILGRAKDTGSTRTS